MTRRRQQGRSAVVAILVGLAVAASVGAAAPTGPDERPVPTGAALRRSVRVFSPAGSVKVWDPHGSVAPVQTTTRKGDQTVIGLKSDILFDFASARLTSAGSARVGTLVAGVARRAPVAVTGYTDAIGDAASNRALSGRRAEAVAAAVSARRDDLVLTVSGRGEAEPVAANTTGDGKDNPEGRAQNRRVEIRYSG